MNIDDALKSERREATADDVPNWSISGGGAGQPRGDWDRSEDNAKACEAFLRSTGLDPVPDAVEQLQYVFLPCLEIISSRGYHPEGNTWRESGWRGIMTDIRKKAQRLWYRGWTNGRFDRDSAIDLINFCGFYIRHGNQGPEWGTWGSPGHSE